MTNIEKARQVASGVWCDPANSHKEMDVELAESFAQRLAMALDHLDTATDVAIWMSGSNDFSPGGVAAVGWEKSRDKLFSAIRYLLNPVGTR